VNFVAHIVVGARCGDVDDALFLTGTALPDFASMARIRLRATPGSLGRGIAFHHATDHEFHTRAWFVELVRELRRSLERASVPDGGARACAHVGVELLLDGALITDTGTARAVDTVYRLVASPTDERVADAVAEPERGAWEDHLRRVTTTLDPRGYEDPATVAGLLWRIAGRRPRLAFDRAHVPAVAAALAALQPRVAASGPAVVDQVASATRRPAVTT
jgi:hypothetical protein